MPVPSVMLSVPLPVVMVKVPGPFAAITVMLPVEVEAERFSKLRYVPASVAMLSAVVTKSITMSAPPA